MEEAFTELEDLNNKTTEGVQNVETLVAELQEINQLIVSAIDRINEISKNTTQLTEQSSQSLQMQFESIRTVSERVGQLSHVSTEMQQEMSKFKI